MKIIKKLAALFVATVIALSVICHASAKQIDFAEWNNHEEVFVIADEDVPSNSGLDFAQLKVKYDYPSHRMRLFFLVKFNSFGEEANPGVRFAFNGDEEVSINLNGEAEYNEDKYYLDFISHTTPENGVVYLEITFGIKEGLPEEKVLSVTFTDPEGILSNTYTVNLTEGEPTDSGEEPTNEEESKTQKTTKTKTTKQKTTKTKTTKSDKTKKTKTEKTATVADEQQSEAELFRNDDSETPNRSENEKVFFVSAAAVVSLGLILSGCLHFLKRNNHKGDKG